MFKPEETLEVTQISLTGTRSLALIGLLIIAPRSFEEIKQIFIEMGIFDKNNSDDILRIDLNTIKSAGCEITRPCPSNGYKYVLKKHPFSLNLTKEDIKLLKKVYNKAKNNSNLNTLINLDNLFKKIAEFVFDEDIKEYILGISVLKYYNIEEIKEFINDCEQHKTIELVYRNPETKKDSQKTIKAQKLVFQNDKIYLYGYDIEKKISTVLLIKRIKKIISKFFDNNNFSINETSVTFKLKNFDTDVLTENEFVIEKNEDFCIINGTYHNDFLAIQRMLYFGPNCTVIEPLEIKNEIITKLKEMREVYND